MVTTQELLDSLKRDKQNLVSMLNNMGVEANDNETFTSLTPKVGKIVSDPVLQDKSITITENGTTNIVADEGYDGLNNVEVTSSISGGETPEVGFVVNEWNSTGYPVDITNIGKTSISNHMFASQLNNNTGTTGYGKFQNLKMVTLP